MATYVSNRDSAGKTDEKGHYKFWSRSFAGNVLDGQQVTQNSPLGMSVLISAGNIRIPYADYAHMGWSEGTTSVTISTSDPTNPRIDRIVAYVDRAMTFLSTDINNPGALKYKAVAGSPNSSPSAVVNSAVDTAVSNNPWVELGQVRVNAAVTQITNTNITDLRLFVSLDPAVNATPVGSVLDFAGATAPAGWLLAYGQAISRSTYAGLFAVLGTTWGAGDGSTTFNIPDLRGRVTAGLDNMGGTSANRLQGITGSLNGDILANTGGQEGHALLPAEMPSTGLAINDPGHSHGVSDPGHSHGHSWSSFVQPIGTTGGGSQRAGSAAGQQTANGDLNINASGSNISINGSGSNTTISTSGTDTPHNTVQPTAIVNKIIKY